MKTVYEATNICKEKVLLTWICLVTDHTVTQISSAAQRGS